MLRPHFYLPVLWDDLRAVNDSYLPPGEPAIHGATDAADYARTYPALRRYTDAWPLPPTSEPTVADYAQVGLAFGLSRRPELREDIDAMGEIRY